jgi:hypothetical protein
MIEPGGTLRYRHFKGGIYEYLHTARLESDPAVNMIVYRAPDDSLWVRTEENFFGTVEQDGRAIRRFAPIE